MVQGHKIERRRHSRKRFSGLLPGPLYLETNRKKSLQCKPIDISKNGLGLLIAEEIPKDAILILVTKEQEIPFKIAWQRPDFGKEELIRYGLEIVDPELDIEEIFIKSGCLIDPI